jgi:serine/threonine-protein kinase
LLKEGLDGPALSLSRGGITGATISLAGDSGTGGSVLETLAASVGDVPRLLLRDTEVDDGGPMVRVASSAMPGPDQRPERIQLLGEIARGGMGAVLKGRDPDLGRDLAVKVLLESHRDKPELVRRFIEEAQIAGQLQHPGIVPVYELGTFPDRRPYFSMKLVKGRTLAEHLQDRASPSDELPCYLDAFQTVCQTMAYAHARGVIHRDLKPSNVMVGNFCEVQVMDWGLAKVLPRGGAVDDATAGKNHEPPKGDTVIATARSGSSADLSQAGSILGTPAYMAPEQARGETEQLDERCDVFALGSILCEVLTGGPAFLGRTTGEIQRKAALGDLADAHVRLDGCGAEPELVELAKNCLAREPEDRPRDAGVVAQRVTAHLEGVQVRLRAAEVARAAEHARLEEAQRTAEAAEARARAEHWIRKLTVALAASLLALASLGIGGYVAMQRQRARHLARTTRGVDEALAEATRLRADARAAQAGGLPLWDEALGAVRRAEELVDHGEADTHLRDRVVRANGRLTRERAEAQARAHRVEADRALLRRLEAIRGGRAAPQEPARTDAQYAGAFRAAGLDVDHAGPQAAGAWIATRSDPVELAAYLDDWTLARRRAKTPEAAWRRLVETAKAADPDPWRNALRAKLETNDAKALDALAGDAKALQTQPATSLVLLAMVLKDLTEDRDRAERVLRQAWQRDPADFWVHFELARLYANPPGVYQMSTNVVRLQQQQDAKEHLTAALAIRPRCLSAREHHAVLLLEQHRPEEALAELRYAVKIEPNDASIRSELAQVMRVQGLHEEAQRELREVQRLDPSLLPSREAPLPPGGEVVAMQAAPSRELFTPAPAAVPSLPSPRQRTAGPPVGLSMRPSVPQNPVPAIDRLVRDAAAAPRNAELQYQAALALLAAHPEGQAYRAFARATLDRLGTTTDPAAAFPVARAALLAPGVSKDSERSVLLAEMSSRQAPTEAWRLYVLGLANYRAGRYEDAVRVLGQSTEAAPHWHAVALNWPVLAMAHLRLGHEDEAKRWLDRAEQADPAAISTWWDRVELQVLRREAEAVVRDPMFPANPFAR